MLRRTPVRRDRKAVALLIVVTLLALFAVVGLSFLLFAESQANSARIWREAQVRPWSDPDVRSIYNNALDQLIYGPDDRPAPQAPENYAFSAMWGNNLARRMYGWTGTAAQNLDPYNGFGIQRNNAAPPGIATVALGGFDHDLINFTYKNTDGFLRMPERVGSAAGGDLATCAPLAWNLRYVAMNAAATYANRDDIYLARIDPTTGKVQVPSFERPDTFGKWNDPLNKNVNPIPAMVPALTAEEVKIGRLRTLRPRPSDQVSAAFTTSTFPLPTVNADGTEGDVENLGGKLNGPQNDSFWLDLDMPVKTWRGKKYKPLVAYLVADLDGRLNINTAGNLMGPVSGPNVQGSTQSNQGWGPWEVNPIAVLPALNGDGYLTHATHGRFATNVNASGPRRTVPTLKWPTTPIGSPSRTFDTFRADAPSYAGVDYDGSQTATSPSELPYDPPKAVAGSFVTQPLFPGRYANASENETDYTPRTTSPPPMPAVLQLPRHALVYNPLLLNGSVRLGASGDRVFPYSDMKMLNYKWNVPTSVDNSYAQASLGIAHATDLAAGTTASATKRWSLTTTSQQIDRFGGMPWMYDVAANGLKQPTTASGPATVRNGFPTGTRVASADPKAYQTTLPAGTIPPDVGLSATNSPDAFRSILSKFPQVDVNRKLRPYTVVATGTAVAPDIDGYVSAASYADATGDRQKLAEDIFNALAAATGAYPGGVSATRNLTTPAAPPFTVDSEEFKALRYLAQMSVNMVDYIDSDDVMTPYNWTAGWDIGMDTATPPAPIQETLWGTEAPRLVINEAFGQYENDAMYIPAPMGVPPVAQPAKGYKIKLWAELHNPLTPPVTVPVAPATSTYNSDPALSNGGTLPTGSGGAAVLTYKDKPVYQMVISTRKNPMLRDIKRADGGIVDNPMAMPPVSDYSTLGAPPATPTPAGEPAWVNSINVRMMKADAPGNNEVMDPQGTAMTIVPPSDGSYGYGDGTSANQTNRSFFLVGPAAFPDLPPLPVASTVAGNFMGPMPNDGMEYYIPANMVNSVLALVPPVAPLPQTTPATGGVPHPTLLLRRLACPLLPPQTDPTMPLFNPYITVDYMEDLPLNDGLITANTVAGMIPATSVLKREQKYSYGRRQPFKGNVAYQKKQVVDSAAAMPFMDAKIQHTLNRHNGEPKIDAAAVATTGDTLLDVPFEWYTHLDRTVISTPELFTVSTLRPHELTQDFFREDATVMPPGSPTIPHGHLADWRNDDQRLWRSLSLLTTRPRTAWMGKEGKIPGKVNINTMESAEVLNAVIDRQEINHFTAADATGVFNTIVNQRSFTNNPAYRLHTPYLPAGAPITLAGSPDSQYPSYASGVGINSTILNPTLFPVSDTPGNPTKHPYIKNEMLIKTYNNLTTKSNCFAVWMTIGYFEVKNDGPYNETNRPILGAEIGSDTGTTQRNRFFSVIDRSGLALDKADSKKQGPPLVFFNHDEEEIGTVATPKQVVTSVPATSSDATSVTGSYDGLGWKVSVGDALFVDTGIAQEPPFPAISPPPSPLPVPPTVTSVLKPGDANPAPPMGAPAYTAPTNTYRITYNVTGTHRPGFAIRNLVIGNPGPQPNFDYANPTYGGVVRYSIQTQ